MFFKSVLFTATLALLVTNSALAESKQTQFFMPGSYQQIERQYAGKPFVLAIWSVDCPSCIKDMAVLDEIRKKHPDLAIVMLSTDEANVSQEAAAILAKHGLIELENWIFGDDAEKLRYEIDPNWYGELPRTYFFAPDHARTGKSGALKLEEFEAQIAQISH